MGANTGTLPSADAGRKPKRGRDIAAVPIDSLSWAPDDVLRSLDTVRRSVEQQAHNALGWYYANKNTKAMTSRLLRLLAIGFATVGGLIPFILNISLIPARWAIEKWGYTLLGAAAACVALDKFFGFSTGWVRYITTAQALQESLYAFQLDWARGMSKLGGEIPTPGQIEAFLQMAKEFSTRVMEVVTQETQQWVMEFQSSLADLEKATKAQIESGRPGALTVTVGNAALSESPVTVDIDGVAYGALSGNAWAARQLAPGMHTVLVTGHKAGKALQGSGTVVVPPGGTAKLDLTFSMADAMAPETPLGA